MTSKRKGARSDGRLLAWVALVGVTILLAFALRFSYDLPEDFRYSYWTVLVGTVSSALTLAVVVLIARSDGLRAMLALNRPVSYARAAVIGVAVLLLPFVMIVLFPFLDASAEQGIGVGWDPERVVPFVLNSVIVVVVAPVVEELTFRGIGFTLLEPYGQGWAVTLTALAFTLTHGPLSNLPIIFAFGAGLAYLRGRTRSVYPGIVVHALLNISGVVGTVTS